MNITKREDGFSLLELSIAIGIMTLLTALTIPSVGIAMDSTRKSVVQGDVTAVAIRLQGWHLNNPYKTPTVVEFTNLKYEVLEDYLASADLQIQNKAYVDGINYVKNTETGKYCVEATKVFPDGKEVSAYYDGAQGSAFIGTCADAPSYN